MAITWLPNTNILSGRLKQLLDMRSYGSKSDWTRISMITIGYLIINDRLYHW